MYRRCLNRGDVKRYELHIPKKRAREPERDIKALLHVHTLGFFYFIFIIISKISCAWIFGPHNMLKSI